MEQFPRLTPDQREAALNALHDVIGTRWSHSTLTTQAYRTQAILRFLDAQGTTFRAASTEDLILYLGYKLLQERKASTLKEYITTLNHLRARLGREMPTYQYQAETLLIEDLRAGLRPLTQDPDQSIPIHPDHIRILLEEDTQTRDLVRVCLKTVSRVDEVINLTPDQIIVLGWGLMQPTMFQLLRGERDPHPAFRIAILWGAKTKSSRSNKFREDLTTIIASNDPAPWMHLILSETLPPELPIFTISEDQLLARLRQLSPNYGLHSLKRAAINKLWSLAAEGRVDTKVIPLLAKHRRDLKEIPDTTVRYNTVEGCVNMALALGSGQATLALPW